MAIIGAPINLSTPLVDALEAMQNLLDRKVQAMVRSITVRDLKYKGQTFAFLEPITLGPPDDPFVLPANSPCMHCQQWDEMGTGALQCKVAVHLESGFLFSLDVMLDKKIKNLDCVLTATYRKNS